ncbi:MAG: hypothetical protein KDK39_14715 [Leptospiraceae bacterium]|nr:hypothetical protein [Leptospiraceae bacterium]
MKKTAGIFAISLIVALAACSSKTDEGTDESTEAAPDSFTVTNNTQSKIVNLLAREKGSAEWGNFELGGGLAAGSETKIQWNDPEEGKCEWEFKAKFADEEESNVFTVDTCKEHDIEFN